MSLRRHLSYSNVTATLALVFAMGGSAIAAKHYLITSTKQIKPRVLKTLEAHATGARGVAGRTGATGAAGATGANGAPGLSALSTLPSGASESGAYDVGSSLPSAGDAVEGDIAFPVPLPAGIPHTNVTHNKPGATTASCPGRGKAASGFLCIYALEEEGVGTFGVFNTEATGSGSGRLGAGILLQGTTTTPYSYGTWTVTAP
jgi:hypothetical protein